MTRVVTKENEGTKERNQKAGLEVRTAEDDSLPLGVTVKESDKKALEQQQLGDLLARAAEDRDE